MKTPKACRQCREGKRRCSRNLGGLGDPCDQCRKRSLPCAGRLVALTPPSAVPLLPQPTQNLAVDSDSPGQECTPSASTQLPRHIAEELIDSYLDKLHNCPQSLFHPVQLRRQVRRSEVNDALLFALCSTGSRFSGDAHVRALECSLMERSKSLLQADLENICLENVQTCVLIANLCAAHLEPRSEALYFRIAINMAQIMRLGTSPSTGSLVDIEVRRRVWWTLFMADCWSSSSLNLPRVAGNSDSEMDLPMDEIVFESLPPEATELDISWRPGLWSHMISLVKLFGPIQNLNRRGVLGNIHAEELQREVASLSQQIENWEWMLPADMKMGYENFERYCQRGMGGPFVALHLGYHHYATLLYFRFLEHPTLASSHGTDTYYQRCKFHASSYSDLLKLAKGTEGCHVIYPTVGHMAVVSSSVLLHALLFGDEENIQHARDRLNSNFEAIVGLSQYWPNTAPMIQRLVTFQNFCLLSAGYRTHQLDGWMLRFLIEYSLPLGEKDVQPVVSGMDLELDMFSERTRALSEQGRYTAFDTPFTYLQ